MDGLQEQLVACAESNDQGCPAADEDTLRAMLETARLVDVRETMPHDLAVLNVLIQRKRELSPQARQCLTNHGVQLELGRTN